MIKRNFLNAKIPYLVLSFLVFLLDQFSKKLIYTFFTLNESILIIKNFFNITYIHNKGLVFGIFSNTQNKFVILLISILSLAALFFLSVYFFAINTKSKLFSFGFSFVLGGAMGNMLDRLIQGYVIDFLDFYIGKYHWPTFNIADTFICIGVLLLFLDIKNTS